MLWAFKVWKSDWGLGIIRSAIFFKGPKKGDMEKSTDENKAGNWAENYQRGKPVWERGEREGINKAAEIGKESKQNNIKYDIGQVYDRSDSHPSRLILDYS